MFLISRLPATEDMTGGEGGGGGGGTETERERESPCRSASTAEGGQVKPRMLEVVNTHETALCETSCHPELVSVNYSPQGSLQPNNPITLD